MGTNVDGKEMRDIREVGAGDYVKTGYQQYEKIATVQDDHGVTTVSGKVVPTTVAKPFHKAADVEGAK